MPMRIRVWIAAVSAVLATVLLPAAADADRTLFVTNSDTPATGLAAFSLAADGSPSAVAGTPVATGEEVTGIAVRPDARFAYVTNLDDDSVGVYELNAGGVPTLQGTTPSGGNQPTGIGFTPDGAFLYVTNRDSTDTAPSVSGFAVDSESGALSPLPGSPFDLGVFDPRAVAVSPDGGFLYITARRGPLGPPVSNADRAIAVASIAASGVPTPIGGSPFFGTPTNPFGAAISPDGSRLFVTALTPDDIEVFNLNPATGAPSAVGGSPFNTGDAPLVLASTPDGSRVYTGLAGTGEAVQGFDVNPATGALSSIAGTPLAAGGDPNGIAIAPDGSTVYSSLLANPGVVSAMTIADNGGLTALTGSPFPTGGVFPSFFSAAVTPTQTPDVKLAIDAKVAGKKTTLDASDSTVRGGFATRYDWEFGDGTSLPDGGPSPQHTYEDPGTYEAIVTVTNDCDPDAVFVDGIASVGNAVYCNGVPEASKLKKVKVAEDEADGSANARKKQKQKGRKIVVKVKVKAGEKLTAVAKGKVKAGGKSYKLGKLTRTVKPKAKKLKLKPKRSSQARKIAAYLATGSKAKARLTVKLTDDAGNAKTQKLRVKLKR